VIFFYFSWHANCLVFNDRINLLSEKMVAGHRVHVLAGLWSWLVPPGHATCDRLKFQITRSKIKNPIASMRSMNGQDSGASIYQFSDQSKHKSVKADYKKPGQRKNALH
jgi:hypothetical protein